MTDTVQTMPIVATGPNFIPQGQAPQRLHDNFSAQSNADASAKFQGKQAMSAKAKAKKFARTTPGSDQEYYLTQRVFGKNAIQ